MINRHRGIGWEYLHVAIDDASRLAYTELLRSAAADAQRLTADVINFSAEASSLKKGETLKDTVEDEGQDQKNDTRYAENQKPDHQPSTAPPPPPPRLRCRRPSACGTRCRKAGRRR